ncbi:unknown [Akkermansia sp. CAG:344]|nr:unknown [Akkermansia sp. CAG:344]
MPLPSAARISQVSRASPGCVNFTLNTSVFGWFPFKVSVWTGWGTEAAAVPDFSVTTHGPFLSPVWLTVTGMSRESPSVAVKGGAGSSITGLFTT